jgi:hypothetical protein
MAYFGSHSGVLPEGHIDIDLSKYLDSLVAEAIQRVLFFLQVLFLETNVGEALPS